MKSALLAASLMVLPGQEHRIANARIEGRSAAEFQTLLRTAAPPFWIAYSAPAIAARRLACCLYAEQECAGCYLEGRREGARFQPGNSVNLDPPGNVVVLYRVANGGIEKVRTFSPDCELDAGGLTVYWLSAVGAQQSLDWLVTLASEDGSGKKGLPSAAATAIAMHAGPEAVEHLIQLARRTSAREAARTALMWLARSQDQRARRFFEEVFSR